MRKVVVVENMTLDGVMQAPGRPDEDVRGGFEHGGWALPYNDSVMGKAMGGRMAEGGDMVFGRRTYEDFYASGRTGRTTLTRRCSTAPRSTWLRRR